MTYWKTRMCLHAENKLIETEYVKIKCGIFQRDSLVTTVILHLLDRSH